MLSLWPLQFWRRLHSEYAMLTSEHSIFMKCRFYGGVQLIPDYSGSRLRCRHPFRRHGARRLCCCQNRLAAQVGCRSVTALLSSQRTAARPRRPEGAQLHTDPYEAKGHLPILLPWPSPTSAGPAGADRDTAPERIIDSLTRSQPN